MDRVMPPPHTAEGLGSTRIPKGGWSRSLGTAEKSRCQTACRALAPAELAASVPAPWQHWLLLNRDRGCARAGLIERADQVGGLQRCAIEAVLDQPATSTTAPASPMAVQSPSWLQWFAASLTRPEPRPRAWRLDTPLAQMDELPAFLPPEECEALMGAISRQLVSCTVARGDSR